MSSHSEPIILTQRMEQSQIARCIPGAYHDKDRKAWVMDPAGLTPRSATVALTLFPGAGVRYPILTHTRDKLIQDVRPFDNATPFDTPVGAPLIRQRVQELYDTAPEGGLYRFQELDLGYLAEVLRQHGSAYLGWDRGMGKTIGALALREELDAHRTLIVAPNTAKAPVWLANVQEFLHDQVQHIEVLPNSKNKREQMLKWVRGWCDRDESCVLIINYEQLRIIGETSREWQKLGSWDLVIADEAHRIKNPKAKMTRAIKKIPTKYKLALSGSIIMNHAAELFSPLQWLFPEQYKSMWRDWNDRYLDYIDGGFSRICIGIKLHKLEDLRRELGVFMVYRRKDDELDLPKRTDETLKVELTPKQRKAYDELRDYCLTQLDDGTNVVAADGLTMLTRLRQVASGLDLFGTGVEDSSKMDLAAEIISDSDEAFVVFTWYKAAARAMHAKLEAMGIEAYVVDGDVPQHDRTTMIAEFQAGQRQVFVGTISTMGESVNLFRANNAIFLDLSWNPGDNQQAADRIYRIGQDRPVTITRIVAANTVDETRVAPSVSNKEALRALILGGN